MDTVNIEYEYYIDGFTFFRNDHSNRKDPWMYCICERFTCSVDGKAKFSNIDEVRYAMLKSKYDADVPADSLTSGTIDLSRSSPSKVWVKEHIARANYQVRIRNTADIPVSEIPRPWEGHGWKENAELMQCNNIILPVSLADNLLENELLDNSDDEHQARIKLESYSTHSVGSPPL